LTVYLVRHAQAGERAAWNGDDRSRPLSGRGRRQSEAIAKRTAHDDVTRLVSSPFRRCVETLEPLGERVGLPVEEDDRLAEGAPFEHTLELMDEVGDGAVLCSHGDVVGDTIAALERRGMKLVGVPDWRKASVWLIDADGDGTHRAHVLPPPDRDPL
jgi:8-oxo-dGTP diphosphatase